MKGSRVNSRLGLYAQCSGVNMARFLFRLQILLDRKNEARQLAEEARLARVAELAGERRTMEELQEELLRTKALYRSKREERASGKADGGPRLACRSGRLRGLQLDVQLGETSVLSQQLFLDRAMEAVDHAVAALAAIRCEVDQLEKQKERAEKTFLAEQNYREELELDEIGTGMYLSRRGSRRGQR